MWEISRIVYAPGTLFHYRAILTLGICALMFLYKAPWAKSTHSLARQYSQAPLTWKIIQIFFKIHEPGIGTVFDFQVEQKITPALPNDGRNVRDGNLLPRSRNSEEESPVALTVEEPPGQAVAACNGVMRCCEVAALHKLCQRIML
ncbi:hypothetical protein R1sor_008315 [Riccia sorocarpa]|uniref:Uncharacterized protein n=1 Tax=Riccia sorocarpa TaxID=122646 RepID=A0ABD3HWG6_9MARC